MDIPEVRDKTGRWLVYFIEKMHYLKLAVELVASLISSVRISWFYSETLVHAAILPRFRPRPHPSTLFRCQYLLIYIKIITR